MEEPRKRSKSMKKILIAAGLVVAGALTVAMAYMTGDYSEYIAAEQDHKELVEELRKLEAEQEMPLISEEDYPTVLPAKTPGDQREEIILTKPPNMIESQDNGTLATGIPPGDNKGDEEDPAVLLEPEVPAEGPSDPGSRTDSGTEKHDTETAPPHQIGRYTGVDLTAAKAKNSDFVAWLTIPGTNVDYPVVLTDHMDYYLTHGFTGKESKLGTLFSLGKTDYKTPGKNISVYGHHITDTSSGQKMFRPLLSYKQKSFWEKHQAVYLDSLYHCGKYRIFAVINMVNNEWDPSTAVFATDDDFLAFVRQAKAQSLYDTGIEISETDHILTLITCDRSFASKEGRLVVMAVEE